MSATIMKENGKSRVTLVVVRFEESLVKKVEPTSIKFFDGIPPFHEMLEHAENVSIKLIFDRGVSPEIVGHRLFSFA